MTLLQIYKRVIALLAPEKSLAISLALASVAIGLVQLAEPILFGRVVDALSKGDAAFPIIGLWAALGLFGIAAGAVVATFADRLAHRTRHAVMSHAFESAMTLPLSYHAERGSSAVVRSILSGSESLFWLWHGAMRDQLTAFFGVLFLVPTAISMDVRMAGILGALAIAYVVMNRLTIAKTSTGQADVERLHSEVSGRVGDVIANVTIVQSYTRLAAEAEAMRGLMENALKAQYPVITWWGVLSVLQRAASTITMVAVFAVGAVLAGRGEMTVGEIVSFVAFAGLLIGRLDQLSGFVMSINRSGPSLRRFFGLIDELPNIAEVPNAKPLIKVAGAVSYENVSFQFPGTAQGIKNVSIEAKPGETIAIVGPTGSGKTTTLSLLQRMRAPDSGRIIIDGHDIRDVTLNSLRQSIAVVFQDAGLFNRSITENIRIGNPKATPADIERACRLAEAHDFIMQKPGGYEFVIGERGASLSGGERQRLSVARAILKDAPILILDEATSALDSETEGKIKRALDRLRENRTTFVIAHRLSTVSDADKIYVLEQGRIIEQGTFTSLAHSGGLFSRLVSEGGFTVPTRPDEERFRAKDAG
jgi:ATP-binding cassette, subfamily B, beta-glucan exporter